MGQNEFAEPLATTGVGSMPGIDVAAATAIVVGEFDVPHLVELPARGPGADMIGRALGMLESTTGDFAGETTPSGWRLTGGRTGGNPGRSMRAASSWFGEDMDCLEERLSGYAGPVKVSFPGPWTLAAAIEAPGGTRLLADAGACADLAAASALCVAEHIGQIRRRVPDARVLVQIDEPMLVEVMRGHVRTASGRGAVRVPESAELLAGLAAVVAAITGAGGVPLAHCCAQHVPYDMFTRAGFRGLSIDLMIHPEEADDDLGSWWDSGRSVFAGVVPPVDVERIAAEQVAARVARIWHRLGFDLAAVGDRTILTPTCGMAGASPSWPRRSAGLLKGSARQLAEGL